MRHFFRFESDQKKKAPFTVPTISNTSPGARGDRGAATDLWPPFLAVRLGADFLLEVDLAGTVAGVNG